MESQQNVYQDPQQAGFYNRNGNGEHVEREGTDNDSIGSNGMMR